MIVTSLFVPLYISPRASSDPLLHSISTFPVAHIRDAPWCYDVAQCRYCLQRISWTRLGDRWQPFDTTGKSHLCRPVTDLETTLIAPQNAVCSNCWKPIMSSRGDECTCLNPSYVEKRHASELKTKAAAVQRAKVRESAHEARELFTCILCDNPAVQAGQIVMCVKNTGHVLPLKYYTQPTHG